MSDLIIPKCVLNFTFSLGSGSFDAADKSMSEATLKGYRAQVTITQQGAPDSSEANIRIFGLDESIMNKLSRVGLYAGEQQNNIVTIDAGVDDDIGTVFTGVIFDAWTDYDNVPNVALNIDARSSVIAALKHAQTTSFNDKVPIVTVMEQIAGKMGYTLENSLSGYAPAVSHPYYAGSYRSQALAAAQAAGIYVFFEDNTKKLVIYSSRGKRDLPKPLISPDTGMVLYPSYAGPGMIRVRSYFNRNIRFAAMMEIKAPDGPDNAPNPANGDWRVTQITHSLTSETPGGNWFTDAVGLKIR